MSGKLPYRLLALALFAALSACSAVNLFSHSSAPSAETEPIVIRFLTNVPDRASGQGLLEQADLEAYVEQNPGVRIITETLQDEPYKMKLQTYMQSGDMPDVWMQWGSRALLYPVLQGGFAAELNISDYDAYGFVPGALDSFSSDGKLYGLPKNADFWVLYYNQKLLWDNGISVPGTTDELIAAAQILKDRGIICVSLAGKDRWPIVATLQTLVLRRTGDPAMLVNGVLDGNLSDVPGVVDGLSEFVRLVDSGVFQPSYKADDCGTSKNLFTQGQAAMLLQGSWEMGMGSDTSIPSGVRNNIRAAKFPTVSGWDGGENDLSMWYGGGYSVYANSRVREEAVRFIGFMVSPEVYAKNAWEMQAVIPPMRYARYLTGRESPLQRDLTDIISSAASTTGDLYNDLHTPSFKNDCENATMDFVNKMISAKGYLTRLDEYAREANAQ